MALFFAGLFISAIFTLVQVIICKYHPKLRKEAGTTHTEVTAPVAQQETGREESPEYEYEQVRSSSVRVQLRNAAQEAGRGEEGGSAGFLMMLITLLLESVEIKFNFEVDFKGGVAN